MKQKRKVAPLTATLIAFGSLAGGAIAQTYQLGQDDGFTMPSSGILRKISTGEEWSWFIVGNDSHPGNYGTVGGDYNWTLTFSQPFELSDFSSLVFISDIDGDSQGKDLLVGAGISVSGGTATLSSIAEIGAGSYDATRGKWSALIQGADPSVSWVATGSSGTFTSLSFQSDNVHAGDYVASQFIVNGFTAVPEPSSALLMGLSGLGLVLRRRR